MLRIHEKQTTLRKIVAYLLAVTMLGTFGVFLVGAVVTSHYFESLNKLSYREFFQWRTLASTGLVSVVGVIGVAMSYAAHKFADELWELLRRRKRVSL